MIIKRLLLTLPFLLLTAAAFAGTPTQYYVDTVNGSDANAGTSFGAAWLTLKHAIETGITRDATNGDQINIYAPVGTPDNYSSGDPAIALGDYAAAASNTAPLIVRGVASNGTDPAIAYITCAGRYLVNLSTFPDLTLINLSVVGGSATGLIQVQFRLNVIGCLIDSSAGGHGLQGNQSCAVIHSDVQGSNGSNYLLNFGTSSGNNVIGSYIHERTNACFCCVGGGRYIGNIIHVATTNSNAYAINANSDYSYVAHNYVLCDTASTSRGIVFSGASSIAINNYVEGYSGAGGVGIVAAGSNSLMIAGNRFFNCTTNVTPGDLTYEANNSSTTASGVVNRATGDYTPTAELKEIGLPLTVGGETTYLNVGAIQQQEGGGGGNVVDPFSGSVPGL